MKYLFLGGAQNGQHLTVAAGSTDVTIPILDDPSFIPDPSIPEVTVRSERYLRVRVQANTRTAQSFLAYCLVGINPEQAFAAWVTVNAAPQPDDLIALSKEIELEVPSHLQVSVGGRTIRWAVDDAAATDAMQSFVQALGPGTEVTP